MSAVPLTTELPPEAAEPQQETVVKRLARGPRQSVLQWLLSRQVPLHRQLLGLLNGEGGAGAGISFVFHMILLGLLAIPVYYSAQPGSVVTTTIEQAPTDPVIITTNLDVDNLMSLPPAEGGGSSKDSFATTDIGPIPWDAQLLSDVNSSQGTDGTVGVGTEGAGLRIKEPKNAVKAGSFTVFTLPIPLGREPTEAGQAPRPGQDYFIVVQMSMPANRSVYPLRDLTGSIVGTDGYTQKIPERAFIMGESGRPEPINPRRGVPVVDGVVQVFIRVPGAQRMVKDTINVKSQLLKEDQELLLTFE